MTNPPRGRAGGDSHDGELAEFTSRGELQRRRFHGGQPKRVADVIARLVQKKGYAQVRIDGRRRDAWQAAAGEAFAALTEPGEVRRGVLEIVAANNLVIQEMTFEKERLLAAMQKALPDAGIKQIRFKVGTVR